MRVLHLCSRYWPGVGGGENYLREVSERLAAEGHAVTVVTTDADDAELFWNPARRRLRVREEQHHGVRIRRFPLRHLPFAPLAYSIWRYLVFPRLAAAPFIPMRWLLALCRYTPWSPEMWRWADATDEAYDLVAAMGILYEPFVAIAHRIARRQGLPFIVYPLTHLGAGPAPAQDKVSRYYTMRHQVALVCAAGRAVVMTPTEGRFYETHGLPRERIHVVPPGVHPEWVQGGEARRFRERHQVPGPLVAFLSAMAYDKGAFDLVEAVRHLWQQGRRVELVMAGKVLEPFRRYLSSLPKTERERVRVLNAISEDDKRDLLAAADIVAMPSRTDSFGILYLEAWLYQKPVIGARAWGMSDVIRHGEDGLLVPFGDAEALAAALAELLDHPERRMALGAHGAEKVRAAYTWEHQYEKLRQVYAEAAALRSR